jgi:hypothetical protein
MAFFLRHTFTDHVIPAKAGMTPWLLESSEHRDG